MWAVEPNESNTVVTLKVENPGNGTVSFNLTDVLENTTLGDHSENVTYNNSKITVPKKVGQYTLTLTSGEKSQTITIKVIDVTLPALGKIVAETIRQDDQSVITDENIRTNTGKVELNNADATNGVKNSPATYKGNVNLMKSAELKVDEVSYNTKFYRARFKVTDFDPENIVAYNKDSLDKYLVEKVPNTSNEVYIYLDANLAKTNLVLAPKAASINQIKKATPFVLNFKSTAVLWIDPGAENTWGLPAGGIHKANISSKGEAMTNNQKGDYSSTYGPITSVKMDKNDEKIVDVGAKIDDLTEYAFDTLKFDVDQTVGAEKHKWVGVSLKVINSNDNDHRQTQVNYVKGDVIIDNGTSGNTQVDPNSRI